MSDKPLMSILKETTKKDHDRLETLVFFKDLMKGMLPLDSYVRYLRILAVLHGTLERELSNSNDERVKTIWNQEMSRYHLLTSDLDYYANNLIKDVVKAVDLTQQFASLMRNQSKKGDLHLLGYLYVFEGSTKGSIKLREFIRKNFHLSPDSTDGLSYFVNYGDHVQQHWECFVNKMNQLNLNIGDTHKICLAAVDCFQRLYDIIDCLDGSLQRDMGYTVIGLNPLGGNHPITQDEGELNASIVAGDRCLEEFPYIKLRYGSSGRYFTLSDSAWLTYLTELGQDALNEQINWLLNVLSTRGLPSLLLERHLIVLYDELMKVYPERESKYLKLKNSAERIAQERLKVIKPEIIKRAEDEFYSKVYDDEGRLLPDAIKILASAISDDLRGISGALQSVLTWLSDKDRFSPQWIKAINDTVKILTP